MSQDSRENLVLRLRSALEGGWGVGGGKTGGGGGQRGGEGEKKRKDMLRAG